MLGNGFGTLQQRAGPIDLAPAVRPDIQPSDHLPAASHSVPTPAVSAQASPAVPATARASIAQPAPHPLQQHSAPPSLPLAQPARGDEIGDSPESPVDDGAGGPGVEGPAAEGCRPFLGVHADDEEDTDEVEGHDDDHRRRRGGTEDGMMVDEDAHDRKRGEDMEEMEELEHDEHDENEDDEVEHEPRTRTTTAASLKVSPSKQHMAAERRCSDRSSSSAATSVRDHSDSPPAVNAATPPSVPITSGHHAAAAAASAAMAAARASNSSPESLHLLLRAASTIISSTVVPPVSAPPLPALRRSKAEDRPVMGAGTALGLRGGPIINGGAGTPGGAMGVPQPYQQPQR
ncbi:hypothetical protein HK101_002715 [Irineochytrium annulatum]|nr:hypothetical protein HK101_002715 [Irineochytrium annulatum]